MYSIGGQTSQQGMIVTEIGPHDVLLGRGAPFLNYEGNKSFREFVRTKRSSYRMLTNNKEKHAFTKEIVVEMQRRGARFLECVDDEASKSRIGVSVHQRLWRVATDKTVMEKCKQTLRDKDPPPKKGNRSSSAIREARNATITYSSTLPSSTFSMTPDAAGLKNEGDATSDNNQHTSTNAYTPQGGWPPPPLLSLWQIPQTGGTQPTSFGAYPPVNTSLSTQQQDSSLNPGNQPLRNIQQQNEVQQLLSWGHYFLESGLQQARQVEQQIRLQSTLALAAASMQALQQHQQLPQSQQPSPHPPTSNTLTSSHGFATSANATAMRPAADNRDLMSFPQQVQFLPTSVVPETNFQAAAPWPAAYSALLNSGSVDVLSGVDAQPAAAMAPTQGEDIHFADIMRGLSGSSTSGSDQQSSFGLGWLQREVSSSNNNNNINRPAEIEAAVGVEEDLTGSSDSSSGDKKHRKLPKDRRT